jgi:hypothetical protein
MFSSVNAGRDGGFMKKSAVLFLVLLAWFGGREAARAADRVVEGAEGCLAMRGEWRPSDYGGGTCRVHRLVIDADDTLTVVAGVNLIVDSAAYNYGTVRTGGRFDCYGAFHNRGTLITEGLTVPGHLIVNTGTFVNRGWLHTHGSIENYGVFENVGGGNIDTCAGAVVNYAYLHNARDGYIDNWSGLIRNEAFLVNDGHIYNPDGSYRIENSGAFENAGYIYNGGVVWNACGGAFYGGGGLSGEPVEYQPCDPGHALHLLIPRVLDAGSPPSPVLSKSDVRRLTAYLARAAKDLEWYLSSPENDGAPAEARVEAFIGDVHGLTAEGILPEYLGAAFVGWAEEILHLISMTPP